MNRVWKRYFITIALATLTQVIVGIIVLGMLDTSDRGGFGFFGGVLIVASFSITAGLVAHEKGRIPIGYLLAGFIAPLLPIVLLLPYTKERKEELLGIAEPDQGAESCPELPPERAAEPLRNPGPSGISPS